MNDPTNKPRLVTAEDLAIRLDVSAATIYRLHKTGRLPGIRLGRAIRFDMEEVLGALRTGQQDRSKGPGDGRDEE